MVQRPNFLFAAFTLLPFVEPAFGFVTENAATNHLRQKLRRNEYVAFLVFRQGFVKIFDDVPKHIQAHQIKSAEGGSLWATNCLTGDLVDFLQRVAVFKHCLNRYHRAEGPDAISDEVGPVIRDHYALSQALVQEAEHETGNFRFGPFSANDLDEMHVTRRIKKVRSQKVRAKIFRTAIGELPDGNAARV